VARVERCTADGEDVTEDIGVGGESVVGDDKGDAGDGGGSAGRFHRGGSFAEKSAGDNEGEDAACGGEDGVAGNGG